MQAIEFTSTVSNGMIRVPERTWLPPNQTVKVIVLIEDASVAALPKRPVCTFQAAHIKTKGFQFNREEIHER